MTLILLAFVAILFGPSFAMPAGGAQVGLGRGALPQFCVVAGGLVHFPESAFERLGTHCDRGQRIVDFVGHAGGEKTDAGQLLVADHLTGALANLSVEVVTVSLRSTSVLAMASYSSP